MPRYLESSRIGLVDAIPLLDGEIIDGPPPPRGLVLTEIVDAVIEPLPPFDSSSSIGQPFDEEPTSPPDRKKYGFYPGVPEGLDEQLTYNQGLTSIVIGGICHALGELLRPRDRSSSSRAIVPYGGTTVIRRVS